MHYYLCYSFTMSKPDLSHKPIQIRRMSLAGSSVLILCLLVAAPILLLFTLGLLFPLPTMLTTSYPGETGLLCPLIPGLVHLPDWPASSRGGRWIPSMKNDPKVFAAQNLEPKTPSTPTKAKFPRKTRPTKGVMNKSDSGSCTP